MTTRFGADGCTCRPFTARTNPPRYLQPGEPVDRATSWQQDRGCVHHTPAPLDPADLLAWAAVIEYRRQQRRNGITILLLPYPPCPTCGSEVHKVDESTVERGIDRTTTLTLSPCGHIHTATDDDVYAIYKHLGDMTEAMERDANSLLPDAREWTTEDVVRDARARLAPPADASAQEADDRRRTLEKAGE